MAEQLKKIGLLLLTLLCCQPVISQPAMPESVDVRIYGGQMILSLEVQPLEGAYTLYDSGGQRIMELVVGQRLEVQAAGQQLRLVYGEAERLLQAPVFLLGRKFENSLGLYPSGIPQLGRSYDDDLVIAAREQELLLINRVAPEKYIAGVVQSESGWGRHEAFYQVQATIARTYALRNLGRHAGESFQLCDQVHCQAYHGKTINPDIIQAVMLSRGDVVVDQNNQLIESVYHANCGGQTVNSGDLWPQALPYLRSVIDPWCSQQPGSLWQVSIPEEEFLGFLESGFSFRPLVGSAARPYTFRQDSRLHFLDDKGQVHLRHIRSRFNLRSTFFSISHHNKQFHLQGRGYGHGVGLCQEGAMQMAIKGFQPGEIISFYYQGVSIISRYVMFPDMVNW